MNLRKCYIVSLFLALSVGLTAQIKLGNNPDTHNSTSLLEMESDSLVFVPTRMNTTDRDAISTPLVGAVIYNTQDSCLQSWNGAEWNCVSASKRNNWFYSPALAIPADTIYNNQTLDLYDEYLDQFNTPMYSSTGAPTSIPVYQSEDLYYYITYYDTTVMNIDSLNSSGVLQYDITTIPSDDYTQINVIFVIKDP